MLKANSKLYTTLFLLFIIILKFLVEFVFNKRLPELKLAHLVLYSSLRTLMKTALRKKDRLRFENF